MIVIKRITVQQKNKDRFNVFIDKGQGEEYGFSVDQDTFIKFQLKKGMEFDEDEMVSLLIENEIKKAFNISLHYLSYRMRSSEEIAVYLKDKEYNESTISEVLKRLTSYNFINDLEFAKAFVRSKARTSSKGPNLIKQELLQKGVTLKDIEQALYEYSIDDQIQNALTYATKKSNATSKKSSAQVKNNIIQTLHQKGFSSEVITEALNEIDMKKDNSMEWDALIYQGEKAMRKNAAFQGWEFNQKVKQYLYRRGFSSELIDKFLKEMKE